MTSPPMSKDKRNNVTNSHRDVNQTSDRASNTQQYTYVKRIVFDDDDSAAGEERSRKSNNNRRAKRRYRVSSEKSSLSFFEKIEEELRLEHNTDDEDSFVSSIMSKDYNQTKHSCAKIEMRENQTKADSHTKSP